MRCAEGAYRRAAELTRGRCGESPSALKQLSGDVTAMALRCGLIAGASPRSARRMRSRLRPVPVVASGAAGGDPSMSHGGVRGATGDTGDAGEPGGTKTLGPGDGTQTLGPVDSTHILGPGAFGGEACVSAELLGRRAAGAGKTSYVLGSFGSCVTTLPPLGPLPVSEHCQPTWLSRRPDS